jgi:hypothetical protein
MSHRYFFRERAGVSKINRLFVFAIIFLGTILLELGDKKSEHFLRE